MTTTHRQHRTRAGTPTSWGQPGASLGSDPQFGGAGQIGQLGEQMTAGILASADLGPGTMVFHDLVPSGGPGNIDHVVLRGDTLVILDSKRWRPGVFRSVAEPNYRDVWDSRSQSWERQTTTRDWVTRDGEEFDPGAASSLSFLADKLLDDLGWDGEVVRVLVVSSTSGNDLDLDFSGFSLSHCEVVRSLDLIETLRQILEKSRSRPVARWAYRLREMSTAPNVVASPYPEALEGPMPEAPPVTADAPPFPMSTVVAVAAAAAMTLAFHVGLLFGAGIGLTGWAGFLTAAPGLVAAILMRIASEPVLRADRDFGSWVAGRYVVNRALGVHRHTGPEPDKAELAWVLTAAGAVAAPVITVVLRGLDRMPLLDLTSGVLKLLGLGLHVVALIALLGGPAILASQYRSLRRLADDWDREWGAFSEDAAALPASMIPLLGLAMGERESSMVWFNHLAQSRSSAWREFAYEASRQAETA